MMETVSVRRIVAAVVAALMAVLISASVSQIPAEAAFPGKNGRIAYQKNGDIWTMNPDGSSKTRLTTSNNFEGNPAFSPNGSRIAYETAGRSIWVMNANGSGKKQLTNGKFFDSDPAWSPNGQRIAFTRNDDIWTMSANGGSFVRLTRTKNQEREPAWSPNGKKIAYTRVGCDGTTGGLCVFDMNANGMNQRNLTPEDSLPGCSNVPSKRHKGNSSEPNYSPDGKRIIFSGTTDCEHSRGKDIWVMDADGSGKVNLINDDGTNDVEPAFSPDGTRMVFASAGRNGLANYAVYTTSASGTSILRAVVTANQYSDPDWSVSAKKKAPKSGA